MTKPILLIMFNLLAACFLIGALLLGFVGTAHELAYVWSLVGFWFCLWAAVSVSNSINKENLYLLEKRLQSAHREMHLAQNPYAE